MKINLLKNDTNTQRNQLTDTNYRPTRYWEQSIELIDRLNWLGK